MVHESAKSWFECLSVVLVDLYGVILNDRIWYIFMSAVIATLCSRNHINVDTNVGWIVGPLIKISLSDRPDDVVADASNTTLYFVDKLAVINNYVIW